MLTLGEVISNIPALDKISIQDSNGIVYLGKCSEFRATFIGAYSMLSHEVNLLRADDNVIIIGLNR